jgi:sulfopyruvate decarboxylase TPP-binding subunit
MLAGADLGGARGGAADAEQRHRQLRQYAVANQGRPVSVSELVSMRGDFGEGNPWQFPMRQAVHPVLDAMGVICLRIEQPEEVVPTVGAPLTMVFQSGQAITVLLTQKLLGAKQF